MEEAAMNFATTVAAGLLLAFAVSGPQAAEKKAAQKEAEGAWPTQRPIRLIVPFAPGGPSDILSRMTGAKLSDSLGQQVVVDNRGSVGGIMGFEIGSKALPDGYTMIVSANSLLTINPHVYKKLPYDPVRDFQPITQLTEGGNVFVVHPSVQAKNIKEFVALAKAQPGKINYATTGTGNVLGIALFKVMAGVDMVAIPYKGTGQAVIDLVAGHVQMFFMSPLVAVQHVKSGRLRALAVTSLTRSPALPDVPTVDESGVKGFQNITWHSILVPAGTPRPIVKRLNAELVKIVRMPDVQDKLSGDGLVAVGSTPEHVTAHMKQESQEIAKLVKRINFEKM
jgi:tripartite-type tricarboxylate transporter receptor subunit TctC